MVRQHREQAGTAYRLLRATGSFERVRLGGEAAKAAPGRVGRAPGCALSCAVPPGNREIIVFGGDIIVSEGVPPKIVKEEIIKCTLPEMLSNVTILPSRPGLGMMLRGAVTMAF